MQLQRLPAELRKSYSSYLTSHSVLSLHQSVSGRQVFHHICFAHHESCVLPYKTSHQTFFTTSRSLTLLSSSHNVLPIPTQQ